MVWNDTTRKQYERKNPRYASDMSDDEWQLVEPYMPPPSHTGHPRKWPLREIVNAILYIASSGCQWEMLPNDFPPPSTVRYLFYKWRDEGLWQTYERIYTITSLAADKLNPELLLQLARDHWQIENRLHYVKDVTFGEDDCRVRTGSAPQVLV